ncbi:MAG: GH25 family lysozyme [Enterococcus lemanii]|jgi:GH25 family lysozyme M1 (1,4-beta-N-acetylmuramidase)
MTYPFGIDISKYQYSSDGKQKPNFDLINQTCDFVAVRAGISWGYTDPWFAYSWAHIVKPRLAYHVIYPGEDARRQTDHFLSIVKPGEHDRLVLDMELDHGYNKTRITDTLLECLALILENTGRYPVIYSRASWVNQFLDVSSLPKLDWWLAGYRKPLPSPLYTPEATPPPALPKGVDNWLIHQTCERGNGSEFGVASHYVDIDRWNTGNKGIAAFFGLTEELPPEPEPPIEENPLYKAKVKPIAPDRLNVRRTPNGQIVRKINAGDIVGVYQDNAGWSRIGIGEWVMSRYIQRLPDEDLIADGLLDVQLWSQQDIRWGGDRMGSSYITLKQEGCLVTAVSSYLNFLGIDTDPKRYNQLLSTRGGYQTPNKMYWKMPDYLWPGKVERAEYSGWFTYGQGWESTAQSILDSGRPALAHVDFIPGGSVQQHWVLLIGHIGGVWWMYDPIDGTISALAARYDKVYRIVGYRKIN